MSKFCCNAKKGINPNDIVQISSLTEELKQTSHGKSQCMQEIIPPPSTTTPAELYPSLLKEKNVKIAQKSIFPDYEVKFKLTKLPSLKEYTAFTNV